MKDNFHHLLFEHALGFCSNVLRTMFLHKRAYVARFIEMKFHTTGFIPIVAWTKGMWFHKLTCRILRIKRIEHAAAFGEIAIRRESHRLPLAVAVDPSQC